MGAIMQYLGEIGETADGAPFSAYYNEDMANLDVEIGIPVAKPVAGKGAIKANKILTGKGVSCIYKGPYSQVGPVYQSMMAWINQKGLIPNGICYEFYFNSPLEVPEKELLTKIVFLLK
jgi:effector-binding domain-containing protein